ncbi:hypothetical protein CWR43_17690 [Rhizobium sullae]|uniref:O-antigen/teichoic acid export membrane protein n=1 Tax=Rhizobium sullae TaxID=50338 RepID=A0A2N0D8D4_RHISU|nr:oligosaccharide flippase family protein [Rhizobium sullae]PKA42365.1 hypothetical protein CWR43_17690 [Rhizobium sullae]
MFKSGAWLLASKIASQTIQFLLFFIAARSLEAADFGLYAVLAAVITLLTIMAEAGWAEQLLRVGYTLPMFRVVTALSFWTASLFTVLSGIAALGVFEFGNFTAAALLAVWSLSILPCTLATSYEAAFTAQGYLRTQAAIRVISEVVGLCSTVAMFAAGIGVFSLALGKVISQTLALFMGWARLGQAPSLRASIRDAANMAEFSHHIVVNRLIIFAGSYCSTFAVAGFQSVTDAAYYRAAERLVAAVSEALGEPIRAIAWVMFRKSSVQGEDQLQKTTRNVVVGTFAVATPIFITLLLYSSQLIHLLLGDRWQASAAIASVLCVRQLLLLPGYFNEPLLSVTGAIGKRLRVTMRNIVILVAVAFLAAPFGPMILAVAQCGVAAYSLFTIAALQESSGGVKWRDICKQLLTVVFPALVVMLAVAYWAGSIRTLSSVPGAAGLILRAAVTTTPYAAILVLSQLWIITRFRWNAGRRGR